MKLLAYAKDVAIFTEDQQSLIEAVKCVRKSSQVTGSGVNWVKFFDLWHGLWPAKLYHFGNVFWVTAPGEYLGVPLNAYRDNEDY